MEKASLKVFNVVIILPVLENIYIQPLALTVLSKSAKEEVALTNC